MQATADTLDLSPPDGGRWRGPLTTALAVHGLLVLALTWGVGWQRDAVVVAEAELWSRLPQQAAPRAVEPEPEPTPPPPPAPKPEPVRPAPPPPAPAAQDAQIALQKKKEQERLKQQQAEQQRREAQKQEEKRKAEQQAQRERQEKQAKLEKAARDKAERERQAKQEAQLEAERKKNLERMLGQANAMGSATARGTAAQSSGPSASYAGRLVSRIRPNIVFTDTVNGNPRAEVEVRALPDGTIVGSRLLKSSGHTAWDDAVLRAIERTGRLPQDENGRVPSTLILGFRPQD